MRRVVAVRTIEDCFDGSYIREFELDEPMDETLMFRLADGGELRYYPHFPRPYYCIRLAGQVQIQGVIGLPSFRVTFGTSAGPEAVDALKQLIEEVT